MKPTSQPQPATADREEWVNTTPTNAGRTLFGPTDRDFEE